MHLGTIVENREGWPVAIDVNVIDVDEEGTPTFAYNPHTVLPLSMKDDENAFVVVSLQ